MHGVLMASLLKAIARQRSLAVPLRLAIGSPVNLRALLKPPVGQDTGLFATIGVSVMLQNAMLGALGASGRPFRFFRPVLKDKALRQVAEIALDRVGLLDHAAIRTSDLSHGQRRQLEVAVALTLNPRAFIMDEPMAGLGASGSRRLTAFLDELRHEAPILLVEHDMDAVFALADRISVLVYGKVIATGSVDEIRNHAEVRRAYLGEDA